MGQFFYFRTNCAIHARVGGSGVDVVTLPDQFVESGKIRGEILLQFFTAMAGNKARNKIQDSYM